MTNGAKVILGIVVALAIGSVAWSLSSNNENTSGQKIITNTENAETQTVGVIHAASNEKVEAVSETHTKNTTTENKKMEHIVIHTNKGDIEVELSATTPKTTENFKKLVSEGFYNGVRFHRVIKGFMIQAGDPLSKDPAMVNRWGTGGPGYKFDDELTGNEKYVTGTLAMANAGPNTNGSQFFIVTAQPGVALPPSYTVFGKVTQGIEVAMAIENVQTNSNDRPLEDVIISSAEVR